MERTEKRKKASFFRCFYQNPATLEKSDSEETKAKLMATPKRMDLTEVPKKRSTVRFEPTPTGHSYSIEEMACDIQLLKDNVRLLEKRNTLLDPKRKRSIAVAGVHEEVAIDGTCSRTCLKYFVDLVSITGLKEISRARHWIVQALWFLTLIFSICITVFYILRSVQTFLEEPSATKVKINRNDSYEYPDMLLCPDTWLDYPKALELGASKGAIQYSLGFLIDYSFRAPPQDFDDYGKAQEDFENWYQARNYSSLVAMFKDIALDSEKFVYKCPYCQYKNFTKVIMDETVCYKIPMYWMSGKGTARSAIDILEVIMPDRTGGLLHKKKYWRLYVEPDLTIGLSTVRFVQVFPGYSNTIRFTPTRYLSLHTLDDPCMDKAPPGYSTVECALACAHKPNKCKSLGSIRQTSAMRNLSEICHYYPPFFKLIYNKSPEKKLVDEIPEECFNQCPPLCDRWLYEASVESHKISSYVPQNSSVNGSKAESLQMTRIYLLNQAPLQGGYMAFTEVNTYPLDVLVGNIGGVLSLWLGASIMSFIQILVFFITWCFARHLNKRQSTAELPTYSNDMVSSYSSNGNANV